MKNNNDNSNTCAWLAYLLIGIIWYFVDEDMKRHNFTKFHVKQALVLLIFSIIWAIVLGILRAILFFGIPFLWSIFLILSYVPLIFAIIGIVNALNNKEKDLPIIGSYAHKMTF
jgi:uncharacterized membrane protein